VIRPFLLFLLLAGSSLCRASGDGAVLDEINLARTQPRQYAAIVEERMRQLPGTDARCVEETASFLSRQEPLAPLRAAPGLIASARLQVVDQGATGAVGHRSSDGSGPLERIARSGQWSGRAGENISYGYSDARSIVVTLIVDQGVPGRGHRRNIFSRSFRLAGAACGAHPRYGAMCVIDFAEGFVPNGERLAASDPWWRAGDW